MAEKHLYDFKDDAWDVPVFFLLFCGPNLEVGCMGGIFWSAGLWGKGSGLSKSMGIVLGTAHHFPVMDFY